MRLLSKLADGGAGHGASARRENDLRRVSMDHTAGREAAGLTAFRQPQRGEPCGSGRIAPRRGEHRSNAVMLINSRVSKEVYSNLKNHHL
jgi:hypothetical protein